MCQLFIDANAIANRKEDVVKVMDLLPSSVRGYGSQKKQWFQDMTVRVGDDQLF